MATENPPSDLCVEVFLALRTGFFEEGGKPKIYGLREKRNTQDDPFDESVHRLLSAGLPGGTSCLKAPGPLITPDLVIMRTEMCHGAPRALLATDLSRIVALEVKKLERTAAGGVARSSGMDYNTTPPCGTVRVYDQSGRPLDIRGSYLFVCQEAVGSEPGRYSLSAMALCDGDLLNADFDYYLSIVSQRTKEVQLGTYGNGANRHRPMLIFANPLGASELDHSVTLVHRRHDLDSQLPQLSRVGVIRRTARTGGPCVFHCYRLRRDVAAGQRPFDLLDPFPSPARNVRTQPRGRFRVHVQPAD